MSGWWIFQNGAVWQVKYWDSDQRKAVVVAEYKSRERAYAHAAWNIVR